MSARDGTVIWCQECGGPWGVLGEGREADLIAAFDVWWGERCVDEFWPEVRDVPPPHDDLPTPRVYRVFWVTEADVRWLTDMGHDLEIAGSGCWNVYHRGCVPEWWVARRLRLMTGWDCCMGLPIPDIERGPDGAEVTDRG